MNDGWIRAPHSSRRSFSVGRCMRLCYEPRWGIFFVCFLCLGLLPARTLQRWRPASTKRKTRRPGKNKQTKKKSMNALPAIPTEALDDNNSDDSLSPKCLGAESCPNPVLCKGLCRAHYFREWQASGLKSGKRQCQKHDFDGPLRKCGKKVHRSGLCVTHWRRTPTCKQDGCRRKALSQKDPRYCSKHGENATEPSRRCSIKRCQLSVSHKNLCRKHYDRQRWQRKRRSRHTRRRISRYDKEEPQLFHRHHHPLDVARMRAQETACLRYVFETTSPNGVFSLKQTSNTRKA